MTYKLKLYQKLTFCSHLEPFGPSATGFLHLSPEQIIEFGTPFPDSSAGAPPYYVLSPVLSLLVFSEVPFHSLSHQCSIASGDKKQYIYIILTYDYSIMDAP